MRSPAGAWPELLCGALAAFAGCERAPRPQDDPNAVAPAGAPPLDIAARPQLLFQVSGDRGNPRVLPVAAVVNGAVRPIGLTQAGWRALDSVYFAAGTKYPLYRDGAPFGEVTVTHGMWSADGPPLQKTLPGCVAMKPLASGQLTLPQPVLDPTVEFIASSVPLATRAPFRGSLPTEAEVAQLGRRFGREVARKASMDTTELDSLDFHARLLPTGATPEPTLLVSFLDPNAGDAGTGVGHTSNLFALGDRTGSAYEPTYRHVQSGDARTVESVRLIDHVDTDGDGVDELILATWRYGADNDLVVLGFRGGAWHELLRVRQSWCLDPPKPKA